MEPLYTSDGFSISQDRKSEVNSLIISKDRQTYFLKNQPQMSVSNNISCYYHNVLSSINLRKGCQRREKWGITEVKTTQTNIFC